jgi:hypothetical protein
MSEPTVGEQLAIINVKLDLLITQRDDHEARLRAVESKVEPPDARVERDRRITALERFQWRQSGAAASVGAVGALLSAGVVKFLG